MGAVDDAALQSLLADVRDGRLSASDAAARLRRLPFADLGFARVDHHRAVRQHVPEAVYGPGEAEIGERKAPQPRRRVRRAEPAVSHVGEQ